MRGRESVGPFWHTAKPGLGEYHNGSQAHQRKQKKNGCAPNIGYSEFPAREVDERLGPRWPCRQLCCIGRQTRLVLREIPRKNGRECGLKKLDSPAPVATSRGGATVPQMHAPAPGSRPVCCGPQRKKPPAITQLTSGGQTASRKRVRKNE